MHSSPLSRELTHHQYLRERLEADFPDADEECLRDTLEGMTNLTDSLAEILRSCLEDQSLTSALKARMADMQERLSRLEERARKKRDLAERSGVSWRTIQRLEATTGVPASRSKNLQSIQRAFENAGVVFIDQNGGGPGVRLKEPLPE